MKWILLNQKSYAGDPLSLSLIGKLSSAGAGGLCVNWKTMGVFWQRTLEVGRRLDPLRFMCKVTELSLWIQFSMLMAQLRS
jgi:hypothetical protein